MPKVAGVIKKYFCFVAVIISSSVHSQNILEGRFNNKGYFFEFYSDNTFEYRKTGLIGIDGYGKGHYTLTKDSLILNYDLTELEHSSYHIARTYLNLKDSIDIKITIYDFEKKPLPNTKVMLSKRGNPYTEKLGTDTGEADMEGKVKLTIKEDSKKPGYLMFFYEDTMYEIHYIVLDMSYEIDVFLSKKNFVEPFHRYSAIKDAFQKYKILKNKHNYYIKLQDSKGSILTLKKVAKGYYANDPFEE